MKKTIPILLLVGLFLLFPNLTHAADLPSSGCFPAVVCGAGSNYYADDCNPAIATLADCTANFGAPDAGKQWAFNCDDGCYQRSDSVPSECPGGIMIAGDCKTLARVVIDGLDNNILKTYALGALTKLVYADCGEGETPVWDDTAHEWGCVIPAAMDPLAPCDDGEVLSWDAGNSEWICGPPNFTYWSANPVDATEIYYNTGNVGIGTTDPTKDLTIGTTVAPGEMRLQGNLSNKYLDMSADGITLSSGGTDYFTVDITGDVHAAMDITSGFSVSSLILDAQNYVESGQYCFSGASDCISNWDQVGGGAIWALSGVDAYYSGGKVGIGTTSPDNKLHVEGGYIENSAGAPQMIFEETDQSNNLWIMGQDATEFWIAHDSTATENRAIQIEESGEVGIGTTNPVAQLHINADTGDPLRAQVSGSTRLLVSDNGGTSIGYNTTPPSQGLYVYGDVGIGDSTPDAKLDVVGSAIFEGDVIIGGSTYKITFPSYGNEIEFDRDNNNYITATDAAGQLIFRTGGDNSRMTIASDGKVGIGTLSPSTQLEVNGTVTATGVTTPWLYGNVNVGSDLTVSNDLLVGGHITSINYSNEFTKESLNGAGAQYVSMTTSTNSICFLTKTWVNETDSSGEDAGCRVYISSNQWRLEAYSEANDADAYCAARCLQY